MPRTLDETSQFKRDKQRIKGSGRCDWDKMRDVAKALMNDRRPGPKYRDHALSGEYAGVRERHVAPDWLVPYDKEGPLTGGSHRRIRTGTHSDLF